MAEAKVKETKAKAEVEKVAPKKSGAKQEKPVVEGLDLLSSMLDRAEELQSRTPAIYAKIHEVAEAVEAVGKKGKVAFNTTKYSYQTAEDLVRVLKPHMIKAGVICYPVKSQKDAYNVELENLVQIKITYRFVAIEDGSYIDVPVLAAGADKGDKGIYKANTGAYKYALKQTFMIETGEDDHDKVPSAQAPATDKHYLSTGRLKGVPYIKESGVGRQSGKPYTIWKAENSRMGDKSEAYWDDNEFRTAGGKIDGEDKAEKTEREVANDDLPF